MTQDRDESADALRYDWNGSRTPSVAIVEAVARATDRTTTELPVLYRTLDGDALDALLASASGASVRISFVFGGVDVTVDSEGAIELRTDEHPDA